MLVLLMSQATNGLGGNEWQKMVDCDDGKVDESLTSVEGVLNDWNPEVMGEERPGDMIFAQPFQIKDRPCTSRQTPAQPSSQPTILSTQRRLASITEMIHVASLLHDDVIDESPLRRNAPSAPQQFGNKLSILSGDFLLGRASVALARLGNNEVVELLATVIANLVEGEVMQLRSPISGTAAEGPTDEAFEMYMRKTYLKTASLMAKSARATVILGGCGHGKSAWVKEAAYAYGRNLGIAFQVSVLR
jgi:hexaprenyl-diphosphate synthase